MNTAPLLTCIKTENDRTSALSLLDQLRASIFHINKDIARVIDSDEKFGKALRESLPETFEKMDPLSAQTEIDKLISELNALPTIQIIVASTPAPSALDAMISFAEAKSAKKAILEIKIQPEILGGAIFTIDGKYIDLSVASKLNKAFDGVNTQELLKTPKL